MLYRCTRKPLVHAIALLGASAFSPVGWAESGKRQLEEVIVTAQKRAQSLTDVPVSVTALSGDKLANAGIENLSDLSEYTPNFKLVEGGFIPNVYMRGVGSGSNQAFELSVGIFADGIHLGRPNQSRAAFMDVERVEVLRGPQSILFGKNAIAGALNIVSARPGDEFEAAISGLYGIDDDQNEFTAFVSTPVTDTFGVRFAVRERRERDGYQYNEQLDVDGPQVDERSVRLTMAYDPLEWLGGALKLEYANRDQRGRTFEFTNSSALTDCSGENATLDRRKSVDGDEGGDVEAYQATLSLESPLESGTINSVTSFSGYNSFDLFDADSSSFDTLNIPGSEGYEQYSQEFRFTSPGGEFMDYIAGIFYQKSDLHFVEAAPIRVRGAAVARTGNCANDTAVLVEADLQRDFVLESEAWSAFAQVTLNWGERWRTTFGLRFVNETKYARRDFFTGDIEELGIDNAVNDAILDGLAINEHSLEDDRDVDQLLPAVNVQFDATEEIMTYISYTKGAKSGSYDARGNNDNDDTFGGGRNFEFDDEVAHAYELGAKMRLFEGSADLNIAVFLVDYEEVQVSVFDGNSAFVVTNAGEARTQGIELDGRWLLTDWFLLSGSAAYLDYEWTNYDQAPCFPGRTDTNEDGSCDLTGDTNLQAPEWTASLSGTFTMPVTDNTVIDWTIDANFKDEHFTSGDLDPRGVQDAVTKYNTRLAWSQTDGQWALSLVGKNLTDEKTRGIGAGSLLDIGGYRSTIEPDRTMYVEGRYRF